MSFLEYRGLQEDRSREREICSLLIVLDQGRNLGTKQVSTVIGNPGMQSLAVAQSPEDPMVPEGRDLPCSVGPT